MPTDIAIKYSKIVIDASVAIKWFCQEDGTRESEDLLSRAFKGQIELCAPELLVYEIANALWKGKKFPRTQIELAIETIYNSPIQLFPLDKLLAGVSVEMMAKYNITFYDASYAALAYIKQVPLLTADVKGHKKIEEIKIIEL